MDQINKKPEKSQLFEVESNNVKNAHNHLFLSELLVTSESINICIRSTDLLYVTRIWFPLVGACSNDDAGGCPMNEWSISLYNFMLHILICFGFFLLFFLQTVWTWTRPELKGNNVLFFSLGLDQMNPNP